jgi:hypothetical protein
LLVLLCGAEQQAAALIATVDQPLAIPLAPRGEGRPPAAGRRQVIITVVGFQPSTAGSVQAIVSVGCGESDVEIGRFAVLPQVAFSAADTDRTQRFSLPLGQEVCRVPRHLTIRLSPNQGDGKGAAMEISEAELK